MEPIDTNKLLNSIMGDIRKEKYSEASFSIAALDQALSMPLADPELGPIIAYRPTQMSRGPVITSNAATQALTDVRMEVEDKAKAVKFARLHFLILTQGFPKQWETAPIGSFHSEI